MMLASVALWAEPSGDPDAASASAQGQLNVFGPAELALVPELAVPDDKLALFQTACLNPTIPGLLLPETAAVTAPSQ